MSRQRSYWACRLSIQYLFRGAEQRTLWELPAPTTCYMWTLTFPDALTRGDPRLAMKRWDSFRHWLVKTEKFGVRAMERGEKGAYHFHVATPQWWDAREMWDAGDRYGFGRVNVRARPVAAAYYIAKYVGKGTDRKWLPRGMRQWACFGFRGCSAKEIIFTDTVRIVVQDTHHDKLYDVLQWMVGDAVAFSHRYRPPHEGADVIHKMELKPSQQKDIISRLLAGKVVVVGEFRGAQVRERKWTDKTTKQEASAVITEFSLEVGGMGQKVTTWAPYGAKLADVKPPVINKGEAVAVLVTKLGGFKDSPEISGEVVPLSTLV